MRSALDPLSTGELLHGVLARVIRIGSDSSLGWISRLPARVEGRLQLRNGSGIRKISLVVLNDERHPGEIVAVLRHVVVEVLHRFEIRLHPLHLRIRDEHNSIHVFQDELPAGVVVDLTGNGVEMEACVEAANSAEVYREEIEEECA